MAGRHNGHMQIGITLPPHDPTYVEARGGVELLSHLRGAAARVEYRRLAIQRAYDRFETAEDGGRSDSEVGGLGLIVLQRALLAVEDLGGVLYAFGGPDPWKRLRSATLPDITMTFDRVLAESEAALAETFRLATDDEIAAEGLAPEQVALLRNVRGQIARRWLDMVRGSAELWTGSPIAKATMHGFPIVSGDELIGPPPAGVLARSIPNRPQGRFAAALISNSPNQSHVNTAVIPVPLDRVSVDRFRHEGQSSVRLYGELCEMHATSTQLGFRALVPWGVLDQLSADLKAALEHLAAERGESR